MAKKKKTTVIQDRDVTKIVPRECEKSDIADLAEAWMEIYAANINVARITPHFIDGLKPGARRMLYGLHMNPNKGTKFMKVIRATADTIVYHPHGDNSVVDVIYKYGQSWKNNLLLIDPQGNYGNVKGQEPAAPRYTECRLTDAARKIFFDDLEDSNVPMRPSYGGDTIEPDYLPARVPMVLCNPAFSGIGIGAASNIPPFNMSEVIAATIKLIKNPKAKIMLIPDSPTGCNIVDNGQFGIINDFGEECKVVMTATYEIDYIANVITITSIPMQQTVDGIISRLVAMKKAGKLDKLLDIADETAEASVRLKLILASDVNPDEYIDSLMKKNIGLKDTFPVKLRVVDNFRTRVWGVTKILLKWIDYRQECVRATYNKKLMNAMNTYHMNKVYLMVLGKNNINKTSDIARTSKTKEEMIQRFMDTYHITSVQAKTLSGMNFSHFTEESYEKFKEIDAKMEKAIKEYEAVITSDEAVDQVIIDQMKEIDKLFGEPRKSAIIKDGKMKEKIPNTDHLIGISRDGYIKKLKLPEHRSIGVVGKTSQVIVAVINNRDNLLIFGDDGKLSRVGVSSIPDMEPEEPGVELSRYFTLTGSPVSVLNEKMVQEGRGDIVIVTKKGFGKKVKMTEFAKIRDVKDCITLTEGDSLVAATPAGEEDFVIYTNFGDGIRLNTESIKYQSKNARGLSLITLRTNEEVVGISFAEKREGIDKILYVTSAGRMKLTDEKLLPLAERRGTAIALLGLESNEYLIGVSFVSMDDTVVVYRRKSAPEEVPIRRLKVTTRIARPEKIVKTPSGDSVISFGIIRG